MKQLPRLIIYFLLCVPYAAAAQFDEIPFNLKGKTILLKAALAKSDSSIFIFDTGATGIVVDSLHAELIGLAGTNRQKTNVAGHGGTQNYTLIPDQQLSFSNKAVLDHVNLILVNFSSFKAVTGAKFDGIIGYDFLNKYVTKIDFDRKCMQLYDQLAEKDTAGYTAIAFEFNKGVNIPRFPMTIKLADGESVTGKVMFDSGADNALLISAPFKNYHRLNDKIGKTVNKRSRGLNVITNDIGATVNEIEFMGFKFRDVDIDLTVNDQAEPKDGYLGIIGMEIIKRFNIIFDYPRKKIYMKPNSTYGMPFEKNSVSSK